MGIRTDEYGADLQRHLMRHTDRVAAIQNTLRVGTPVGSMP